MGLVINCVAGVNHSELLDITERSLFGAMSETTEVTCPTDEYVGGVVKGGGVCVDHMTCRWRISCQCIHAHLSCDAGVQRGGAY